MLGSSRATESEAVQSTMYLSHTMAGESGNAIYSYYSTRVIHIKTAFSYRTDAFLVALRRFTWQWELYRTFTTDCGTNFVSGNAELPSSRVRSSRSNWRSSAQGENSSNQERFISAGYELHSKRWRRCCTKWMPVWIHGHSTHYRVYMIPTACACIRIETYCSSPSRSQC